MVLGVWALGVILFFSFEYAFVVPYSTVSIDWAPGGAAVVSEDCRCAAADGPGSDQIRAGDVFVAIDGQPVRNSDLQFRFRSAGPSHDYEFERGGARFSVDLLSGTPSTTEQVNRLLPGLVALEAWLFGFVVVLLAPPGNRDVWLVGLVMMGLAVALAGAPAAALGIPGSRLAYEVLAPIMSVGYIEIALIPRQLGRRPPVAIQLLYGSAVVVAVLSLVEILFLNPSYTWQSATGIRLEAIVLVMLGLAILVAPAIMAIRALRMRQASPYTRRQVVILLAGTGLALLPFTFLTALPRAVTGASWLPLEVTLPLLGAIPATYAYVIFRHRYLALDLFVARSIALLLAVLLAATLFVTGYRLARQVSESATFAPIIGAISLVVGVVVVGRASSRLRPAIDVFLYGPDRHYDETLTRLRDELLADPQNQTLRKVLLEKVPETLEVRDAALLLADGAGLLAPVGSSRGKQADAIRADELRELSHPVLRQAEPSAPVFKAAPWARLAIVLRLRDETIGVLLLGEKAYGDYFDARDAAFVQRLAAWAGVAIENVHLFDAQQQTMAELLRVRTAERAQLAGRLHDEALQSAFSVAGALDQMEADLPPESPAAVELQKQRKKVRDLIRELREISTGIRPPILNQGLLFAIDDVIRDFTEHFAGIDVERASPSEEPPPLSDEALDAAYHVVKEALHNVGKHAHATRVVIRVECIAGTVRIVVSDNGQTRAPASLSLPALFRGQHQGIVGMHQWAMAARGRIRITPGPQQGTEVELTLPLNGSRGV